MNVRDSENDDRCPCGRDATLVECCGPLLDGRPAPTAERLMRSRYTAFALGNSAYLLASWHASTRPRTVRPEPGVRWTGLEVVATEAGSMFHTEGTVEFRAHYVEDGRPGVLVEHSRFVREDGHWFYLDGSHPDPR